MKAKRLSFQDAFPLIEGKFKFDLLIKNPVSKEFTSFESEIVIPEAVSRPGLGPLLLSSRFNREPSPRADFRPFKLGDVQTYPIATRTFARSDRLHIALGIEGLPQGLKETGSLEFSLFREDKKVHTQNKALKDLGSAEYCFEEIALTDLDPGMYRLVVSLLDQDKKEISSSKEDFSISTQGSVPAVWSLSEIIPPLDDPYYSYVLGMELLNCGKTEEARALLEEAYQKRPVSLEFALGLGQALVRSGDCQKVQTLLTRFLEKANQQSQIYDLLGRCSFSLKNYGQAIYYFKKYISHFGTNLEILNLLAESFYETGELEEARAAWKKSLEIEPRQEQIKKKLEALEKKIVRTNVSQMEVRT